MPPIVCVRVCVRVRVCVCVCVCEVALHATHCPLLTFYSITSSVPILCTSHNGICYTHAHGPPSAHHNLCLHTTHYWHQHLLHPLHVTHHYLFLQPLSILYALRQKKYALQPFSHPLRACHTHLTHTHTHKHTHTSHTRHTHLTHTTDIWRTICTLQDTCVQRMRRWVGGRRTVDERGGGIRLPPHSSTSMGVHHQRI